MTVYDSGYVCFEQVIKLLHSQSLQSWVVWGQLEQQQYRRIRVVSSFCWTWHVVGVWLGFQPENQQYQVDIFDCEKEFK